MDTPLRFGVCLTIVVELPIMSPTGKELEIFPGNKVRLLEGELTNGQNPREVFFVREAPAPNQSGVVILEGLLTKREIIISMDEVVLKEKVES